jgi:hypothetical protein
VVLQVALQTYLLVHPVHLAVRLLVQKHLLYQRVLPQVKYQVASCLAVQQDYLWLQALRKKWGVNWQAAQPGCLLLATQTLCALHHHQAQLLV